MTEPATKTPETTVVNWRDFDPAWLPGGVDDPLASEWTTYRDHLDELLQQAEQGARFVAIKGTEILGYYRNRRAAVNAAVSRFGPTPVLIKQIVEEESTRRLGGAEVGCPS